VSKLNTFMECGVYPRVAHRSIGNYEILRFLKNVNFSATIKISSKFNLSAAILKRELFFIFQTFNFTREVIF
jgi:hypothetical protein